MFSDFTMSPEDMDLEVVELDNHTCNTCINMISSHSNMSVFLKNLKLAVKEKIQVSMLALFDLAHL